MSIFSKVLSILLLTLNFIAIVFVLLSINRLVALNEFDIGNSLSAVTAIIGLYPLWRFSHFTVTGTKLKSLQKLVNNRSILLAGHALLWGISLLLWFYIVPTMGKVHYHWGLEDKNAKAYSKALDHYQRSLYHGNDTADTHFDMAEIYEHFANVKDAINHYWLGIYADRKYPAAAFNNLAILLLTKGDTTSALDLLDLADTRISDVSQSQQWLLLGVVNKNRAWVFWKLGIYAEANKYIQDAINTLLAANELDNYPEVHCLKALIDAQKPVSNTFDSNPLSANAVKRCKNSQIGKRAQPFYGATRDLYIQVLKQFSN